MLRNNHGLTLIEMLVVLVLSSIIVAASYRVIIGGQKVYTVQDQVADMQQNARAALDRMNREIRMAGYEKEILESLGNINGFTKIITPRNNANNVGKNDDQITIIIADKAITYRLQWDTTDPGMPVLVRTENGVSEVMAENIEGLQVSYILRNGTVTDSPTSPEKVRMVRISLMARTKLTDPQLGGDGYRRRGLSSLMIVRNLEA
jgi:prepilin-type N-terminal cleavage/methylation domain-containing protein